jgi:hypothetical protein
MGSYPYIAVVMPCTVYTTPLAAQVTDFEMICPISRGAYGRVYKVKHKATGAEC